MKKWYTSKTIWFNVITVALGIMQVVSDTYPIPTEALSMIIGVGNVVLRFLTTNSIGSEK